MANNGVRTELIKSMGQNQDTKASGVMKIFTLLAWDSILKDFQTIKSPEGVR